MINKKKVLTMTYDMEDFLRSSVELYLQLFPDAPKLKPVASPCIVEDHEDAPVAVPWTGTSDRQEDVLGVSGISGDAATAYTDTDCELEVVRSQSFCVPVARVIMKIMYAARMARPDLIRAIGYLARYLTKGSPEFDEASQADVLRAEFSRV